MNKHKKKLLVFVLAALAFILNACISPMGMTASSTPLQGKVIEENRGQAEGSDASFSILGIPFGYPDIDIAIQDAVKSKQGDALINLRWYQKNYNFILFNRASVIVTGDVVKFKENR
ncbi:MAG: hypothetical protein OEZ22_09670 [Spirochaetia bacterium]|nr:hypothetical protein [Spirochaetia bacterium]